MENPFTTSPYVSKSLFCDREEELNTLCQYIEAGSNITLISPRRYGKTGLIYRTFDALREQKKPIRTFYVDIYATQSIDDFIEKLTESLVDVLGKTSAIKKLFKTIAGIRPVLSYDPINHNAKLSFTFANEQEKKLSIKAIFDFLEAEDQKVLIAIDEFQQIREYDEAGYMEALLRSYIQPLKNVQFIFCGSKRHIMTNMFADARSPFYESTRFLYLDKINADAYSAFIEQKFAEGGKTITQEAIDYILEWTRRHTFYTQSLCNLIYQQANKKVTLLNVYQAIDMTLKSNAETFIQWRELLTKQQWNFLKAVAKEGTLTQPTASKFLQKYNIGTPSNAKRILNALVEKELLLSLASLDSTSYVVYNVFLSRWLETI